MTRLEKELMASFRELGIETSNRRDMLTLLNLLKMKGDAGRLHYEHSIRVSFLCRKIAAHMHLDEKAAFYSGLLHDVGKAAVPLDILSKTHEWTAKDAREMEKHVKMAFLLLSGRFDFSAQAGAWHHRFQERLYPKRLPRSLHRYSEASKWAIATYGRIVSLADTYDAMHRVNSATGGRALGETEIRERLLKVNPDLKILIESLYASEILGPV